MLAHNLFYGPVNVLLCVCVWGGGGCWDTLEIRYGLFWNVN
jgi:hypothetical protein